MFVIYFCMNVFQTNSICNRNEYIKFFFTSSAKFYHRILLLNNLCYISTCFYVLV